MSNLIFNNPHNPRKNFTIVPNAIFRDKEIPNKAVGLYCRLCSVPRDRFDINIRGLATMSDDSIDGVRAQLQILQDHGYLDRERSKSTRRGRSDDIYTIYQDPKGILDPNEARINGFEDRLGIASDEDDWGRPEPESREESRQLDDWGDDDTIDSFAVIDEDESW